MTAEVGGTSGDIPLNGYSTGGMDIDDGKNYSLTGRHEYVCDGEDAIEDYFREMWDKDSSAFISTGFLTKKMPFDAWVTQLSDEQFSEYKLKADNLVSRLNDVDSSGTKSFFEEAYEDAVKSTYPKPSFNEWLTDMDSKEFVGLNRKFTAEKNDSLDYLEERYKELCPPKLGSTTYTRPTFEEWLAGMTKSEFENKCDTAQTIKEFQDSVNQTDYFFQKYLEENPEYTGSAEDLKNDPGFKTWLEGKGTGTRADYLEASTKHVKEGESPDGYEGIVTFEDVDVHYNEKTGEIWGLDIQALRDKGVSAAAILSLIMSIKGNAAENQAKEKVDEMEKYNDMIKEANEALGRLSNDRRKVSSKIIALFVKYKGKDPGFSDLGFDCGNNASLNSIFNKFKSECKSHGCYNDFFDSNGKIRDDVSLTKIANKMEDWNIPDRDYWPSLGTNKDKLPTRRSSWETLINNFSDEVNSKIQTLTTETQDKNKQYDKLTSTASQIYQKFMNLEETITRNIA